MSGATAEEQVTQWLRARAIPLDGLAPLRIALNGVRVVGLGEATHGSREFFLIRHRLLEFLVEELGFTTLAVEASASASRAVDDYVQGGSGDPVEALAGLGFWTLHTAEMLATVEWLRDHNRTAARKVRFAGVDPQHPAASLDALRAHLGAAARDLLDPLAPLAGKRLGVGPPLDRRIEADARRLEEFLTGRSAPDEALAHARIVRQNADLASRPFRHPDPTQTVSVARDRHLADNVDLLLTDPDARVALWAHNGHVMKGAHSGGSVPAMGLHLGQRHGEAYYALGVLFGAGRFRARRARFGKVDPARPPVTFRVPLVRRPTIVEARLAAAHPGDHVIDLRNGPRPEAVTRWLGEPLNMRGYGAVARRFTYRLGYMPTVLAEHFDGIAFVPEVTASTPL
ncbi:erythromycin esterase family protein [Microbispora hainanensis]|uniref:Erythromycin esterase family protein n=1 Tax=Microbispora hainanensis TaxID=568844 RepID=A0A544YMP2_9ACTN|nr:erythromycin esterase family protein [Microbispora hainanensis]TQS18039.1 erythromycin esterase family protein [Microbispora hainanensis]